MNRILEINNLKVSCKYKAVLDGVSLSLNAGGILGIVGESGSGKSTLLKAIMGILPNNWHTTEGEIIFKGRNLLKLSNEQLRTVRGAQIGMIFQNTAAALCPLRSIGVQLAESLRAHGRHNQQEIYAAAMALFAALDLDEPERIWHSYPFELSGGMSQRVGIAMAALLKPEILLADEPTSALDIINQDGIIQELKKLQADSNAAIVFVTHNISLIAKFAEQIAVMQDGRIIEYGTAKEIINNPQAKYTRSLIQAVPRLIRS